MEEQKRRNWAEDDSDEWEENEEVPLPPKGPSQPELPPRPASFGLKRDALQGVDPPYSIEVGNLPFALDSEAKVLPYLTKGLSNHDIAFRPFNETLRGTVRVTTNTPDVARHVLGLDGSEETGRALRVKLFYSDRSQGDRGQGRGGRGRRGEPRRGGGDRRSGDARRPPRPAYPAVIENRNVAYSRKEADPVPARPKVEETKSEPVTPAQPIVQAVVQPVVQAPVAPKSEIGRPKLDPFGGAKPIDTKAKDLAFEERAKKDKQPESPAKPASKWTEPRSAEVRRGEPKSAELRGKSGDIPEFKDERSVEEIKTEAKQAEKPIEPVKSAEAVKPTEPVKPVEIVKPAETVKPVISTEKPKREEYRVVERTSPTIDTKPEEPARLNSPKPVEEKGSGPSPDPKPDSTPRSPANFTLSEPDWDFSDPGSEGQYREEYHRDYHPRGGRKSRRYVRTGKMRGDRGKQEGPMSAVLQEEKKEEPVVDPPPMPRKRAWTSDEDDRNALSKPAVPIEAKIVKPEEPVRGRGNRGRGRQFR